VSSADTITGAYLAWLENRPWKDRMREALREAIDVDATEQAARGYMNLHAMLTACCDFSEADSCYLERATFCAEHDLPTFSLCLRASHALSLSARGRWDEAVAASRQVLQAGPSPFNRLIPTPVLGRILARRSDREARLLMNDGVRIADATDRPSAVADAHIARAEAHWLIGDTDAAVDDVEIAARVAEPTHASTRAHVATWQQRLGLPVTVPVDGFTEAHARSLATDHPGAAQLWDERGVPYEAGLALLDGQSESQLREALQRFDALGAVATARLTRRRMRARGMRGIPSGSCPATRAHPAGLTHREGQVLALICAGQTNAEISHELVVSPRTVDHHVSSLLAKMGVRSRAQAAEQADRLGLVEGAPSPARGHRRS
jgi:DNA-binding CsgD family transcriptional regulator